MSMQIPNTGEIGSDPFNDAQLVSIPLVIYDNGDLKFWYDEALDYSGAHQLHCSLDAGGNVSHRIDVPIILPAPALIDCEAICLNRLRSKPVRLQLFLDNRRR